MAICFNQTIGKSMNRLNKQAYFLLTSGKLNEQSQKCLYSTQVTPTDDSKPIMSTFRRGTGGRSSYSGNTVTVFGATGIMGRILVNRLGKEGSQVIVAYRGDQWNARGLKLCGDLGQIQFQEIDIKNIDTIRRAVKHSNLVINCLGAHYETRNFKFKDVHVNAAKLIGQVCRECNVDKLIHFSSLNASPTPQTIFKPSEFLISKYQGELAVRDEYPDVVIVRPAVIYGESDRFLYYYVNELRRGLETIQLWKKGEMTIKMPVHQINVADGVMKILHNKDIRGQTYDFVGPNSYLLSDVVDFIFQNLYRDIKRIPLTPTRLGISYLNEKIFKRPNFNLDVLEREFISDALSTDSRNPTLAELGVNFKSFEDMTAWHLKVFNKHSYYSEKLGEFPTPKPPKALSEDYEYQLRRKIRQ